MILKSVRVFAIKGLIVMVQTNDIAFIIYTNDQMPATGVQKSGDGFHRGLFQSTVEFPFSDIPPER